MDMWDAESYMSGWDYIREAIRERQYSLPGAVTDIRCNNREDQSRYKQRQVECYSTTGKKQREKPD